MFDDIDLLPHRFFSSAKLWSFCFRSPCPRVIIKFRSTNPPSVFSNPKFIHNLEGPLSYTFPDIVSRLRKEFKVKLSLGGRPLNILVCTIHIAGTIYIEFIRTSKGCHISYQESTGNRNALYDSVLNKK